MERPFDEELKGLKAKILEMAAYAEESIAFAVRCLKDRNEALVSEVMKREESINYLEIEIDELCMRLLALRQPMAADLRFITSAMKITSDLERIGDQAVNIIENAHHVLKAAPLKPLVDMPVMGEISERMVRDSLNALVEKDCSLANRVFEEEKKVDAYRDQIFRVLLTYMMADPGTIERALALILISRNLERVGDHATNIAEEVIYLVEGREVRHRYESAMRISES